MATLPAMYPTHPKRGGIAAVLLVLFLLLSIGGAGYYYFTEADKETYQTETVEIARGISQSFRQLEEKPTNQDILKLRDEIESYTNRQGADLSALAQWQSKLSEAEDLVAAREAQAEEMQSRLEALDSDNSLAELETFESELKPVAHSLDPISRNRLLENWNQRKRTILAEIQSVSATIIAKTFPSGAKTYLDGEYIGLSSLGIQNVRKGKHLLRFEKEGYVTAEREIRVTQSGKFEPEAVELQLATNPVKIEVTGGKKRSKILVSIEKTADNNKDILLFIEEKEGRKVTFLNAPLGLINISVTADNRLASEQSYLNETGQSQVIQIKL